jgi:CubicO group peptidase (beta-lactamase class C family)
LAEVKAPQSRGSGAIGRPVRTLFITFVVLVGFVSVEQSTRAQSLAIGLFERYLEPLRTQAGIPGLSGAIVQNRRVVWSGVYGFADLERLVQMDERVPFPVGYLSQPLGATLLMRRVERGEMDLDDRANQWTNVPEANATLRQILSHTSTGTYRYDPARFGILTPIVELSAGDPYRVVLADEILEHCAMTDSVPGHDLESASAAWRDHFDSAKLAQYEAVLRRIALPYRVDARGRPTRSEFPPRAINAATGLVTTARDLAKFDACLDEGVLLRRDTVAITRSGVGPGAPTGLGWFVQIYNGELLVWQFGSSPGAYSSMILKVPARNLTLILLANSDGLSEPFALHQGDVTTSLFAKLFLRTFLS